jgi:hypothetical protein
MSANASEGHADKVEIGVEPVNLKRILDVIRRCAVAVVVGVLLRNAKLVCALHDRDVSKEFSFEH